MQVKKNIPKIIASAIQTYLSGDSSRSIRQIAHYSDVTKSYIHRLSREEIPYEKLEPLRVFHVLKFVRNLEFAYEVIENNAEWALKLKRWLGVDKEFMRESVDDKNVEELILQNDYNMLAFVLACNHAGTSFEQLQKLGGEKLASAAEKLLNQEIFVMQGERIKEQVKNLKKGNFFTFTPESLKRLLPVLIRYCDTENRLYGSLSMATGSFNKDFYLKVKEKNQEFRRWYDEERRKEKNKGNIPGFMIIVSDTFTTQEK